MALKRSNRMAVVQRLAKQKESALIEALGQTQQLLGKEQNQLQELSRYRSEYASQKGQLGQSGFGGESLRNYVAFMANLDQAYEQQCQQIDLIQQRIDQLKKQWAEAHARAKNLDKLVASYKESELLELEKQLQRELDDRPVRPLI